MNHGRADIVDPPRLSDSGPEPRPAWTLLRTSWFCQNFSESYLLQPLLAGEVALAAGNVGEPFVDTEDIADIAVAALTEDGHAGRCETPPRPGCGTGAYMQRHERTT